MKLTTTCDQKSCDCIVLGIGPEGQWSATAADLDTQSGGALSRGVATGDVSQKQGDATLVPLPGSAAFASVLLVGTGHAESKDIDAPLAYRMGATALRKLSGRQREKVCVELGAELTDSVAEALVAGAVAGTAGQSLYHSEAQLFPPQLVAFLGVSEEALVAGQAIGEAINATRRLVNEPGNVIYPETFAEAATEVAKQWGLEIEVWDEQRLEQENCQAMLAVGKGSVRPPRLVKLTYRGNPQQTTPPIALVGKGVTFDSGGLSLKPSASMLDMKMDMAGAGTVLGVIRCLADLKANCNVVGYMGLAENMIDGNSYRLGDVVKTRSGKTVEIHNTDAEGRVVLADVLDVAVKDEPAAVVDLATLTGACLVALGADTVGLMGNDQELQQEIQQAAEQQGEWVWPLPMYSFFDEQVKSKVADLKNVGAGRWGGAITAAKFLEAFVGDAKWLHMDIAGPAFAESPTPERDAGATGAMVRTLVHWLRKRK
ncbi:leucyl aminopeptidase [Roseimaritima ulvae]|uniref:Probable cytosol aminopeptidase n=1 Tax=Roseimaritima ulvae TaxID=980254 RepID=A0A5B9QLB7_9BACT|nr:leucyl aminopeptidase [Roseimaritima ulvae]QEG39818.1 Cytosol aminopeptidase [Roseimaritima ulvae]